MTEFEEQKKTLEEERKWLESVRDEVDSRIHRGGAQAVGKPG